MGQADQDKIDLFILNQMDEKARKAFESQMAKDQQLAAEVKLQQEAYDLLYDLGKQDVKSYLDQVHEKVAQKYNPTSNKKWLVLAGLLLLLSLALGYYFFKSPATQIPQPPQAIYAQYFEAYPLSFTSRDDTQNIQLQEVHSLYQDQQFEAALPVIQSLLVNDNDPKLQLAAGISAVAQGNASLGLEYFNELIETKDPLYLSHAQWYAALAALQLNDTNLAKKHLQSLVDSNTAFKQTESKTILQSLQ